MYSDYALIKKTTLTEIGDAIRNQKGTTKPIDPVNFGSEISAIEGGTLVEGGFTVNFHNEDGTLIESHSAELGRDVYAPASFNEVNYWSNADGVPYTLPLTINTSDTVLNLYATEAKTCAQVLYDYFGLEQATYPQVGINVQSNGNVIAIYFGNSILSIGGTQRLYYKSGNYIFQDIVHDTIAVIQKILSLSIDSWTVYNNPSGDYLSSSTTAGLYANINPGFDIDGRLDEVMYDTNDRLHPYALQEKTVTESGDVVPDEGYYGLSKVSVNVESGASIDGGYTVNFYNENEELLGSYSTLCGYEIDKPISYTVKSWIDSNNDAYVFPLTINTPNSILDLYAHTNTTCVDELYSAYGVDINEYPYVFAIISDGDDVVLSFAKEYSKSTGIAGNMLVYNECLYCYQAFSNASGKDLTSAQEITNLFISNNLSISSYDEQSTYVQTSSMNAVASNVVDIADYCTGFVNLNAPYNLN